MVADRGSLQVAPLMLSRKYSSTNGDADNYFGAGAHQPPLAPVLLLHTWPHNTRILYTMHTVRGGGTSFAASRIEHDDDTPKPVRVGSRACTVSALAEGPFGSPLWFAPPEHKLGRSHAAYKLNAPCPSKHCILLCVL